MSALTTNAAPTDDIVVETLERPSAVICRTTFARTEPAKLARAREYG
jgi:hypothetical protein